MLQHLSADRNFSSFAEINCVKTTAVPVRRQVLEHLQPTDADAHASSGFRPAVDEDSLRTGRPFARYQRGVLSRSVTAHSFPSSISRGRLRNADLWRFGLAPKFLSRWLYIRTLPSRAHRLRYQDALLVRAANPRRLEPPLPATCSSAPGKLTHWSCSRCQPACRYAWWLA